MVVVRIMPIMGNFSSPPLKHKHNVADVNGVSVSSTEINYLSGVTSNVQTQINEIRSASNRISVVLKGVPGMTYTISNSKETFSGTIPTTGSSLVYVNYVDTYTIVSKLNTATYTIKYTIEYIGVHIVRIYKISTFANDSFAVISAASKAGLLSSYYSIGDTKDIILNGTVGNNLSFSNYKTYLQIVAFDHNSDLEMNGEHHMICCLGRTSLTGGNEICFVESTYGYEISSQYLNMNTSNKNSGGWASSGMRNVICINLQNALPSDLKSVLRPRTIYTDNVGNSATDARSAVTLSTDTVYIPSEFEIFGIRSRANEYEQTRQRQLEYFKNASKIRNSHNNNVTSGAVDWWLRSIIHASTSDFCMVDSSGYSSYSSASKSLGFVPLITI